MTAKRFVNENNCCGYYTEVIDNEKGLDLLIPNPKKNLTIEELIDLLNELYEENIMLKGEAAHYKLILMSLEEQARRLSKIRYVGDMND